MRYTTLWDCHMVKIGFVYLTAVGAWATRLTSFLNLDSMTESKDRENECLNIRLVSDVLYTQKVRLTLLRLRIFTICLICKSSVAQSQHWRTQEMCNDSAANEKKKNDYFFRCRYYLSTHLNRIHGTAATHILIYQREIYSQKQLTSSVRWAKICLSCGCDVILCI